MSESLFIMGKPNARDVLVHYAQPVDFVGPCGPVAAKAMPSGLPPEIRVRQHPDGVHLFAFIALGMVYDPAKPPVALFAALTPGDLDALSARARDAANAVRKHNAQADPYHGVGFEPEPTDEHAAWLAGGGHTNMNTEVHTTVLPHTTSGDE